MTEIDTEVKEGVKELLDIIKNTYHNDNSFKTEFLKTINASDDNLKALCQKIMAI